MAVTMSDVARRAGVSVKTVSNVINGYPYLRPETRERVEAAICELDYQLNATARSLRTGRTSLISLAVPELRLGYFAELADAVIEEAREHGLTVLVEQHGGEREREIEVLTSARRRLSDGLIYSPVALGPGDEDLLASDAPLVVLGERLFPTDVDHVTMHNVAAARAGTEHLLGLGRRRIAVVGVNPGQSVGSAPLRLQGYREALAAAGVPFDETLIGVSPRWDRAAGAATTARLLDGGAAPDAVFGLNDSLALGAMHELQVRRIAVPDDVAVLGFDDLDEGRYANPTLSTVDAGRAAIARTAVRRLVDQVAARPGSRRPERVQAPFRVVQRGSTVRSG